MPALIWPLLDKLNAPLAFQRRPKSQANRGVNRIPAMPWDASSRPGVPISGQVDSDPTLWEVAPWAFGLAALKVQSRRLQEFKTNPRVSKFSEQTKEPAVVHPLGLWQVFPPGLPPAAREKTSRIIWPLARRLFFDPTSIVRQAPVNTDLRSAVPGLVGAQQKPKAAPQRATPSLPWSKLGSSSVKPAVVHPIKLPSRIGMIRGITRDSTGAVLGSCTVELYETATDIALFKTVSDASTGAFTFTCARYSPATHYIVAYKAGSPDVAGTTLNTLTAE